MTTLARIREKVRRLTGRSSPTQITDAEIDQYVDDFYLNDFPEFCRVKSLQENLVINLEQGEDLYAFDANSYNANGPPAYVGGIEIAYTQSQERFFNWYPMALQQEDVGDTDGATPTFTFTLQNTPIAHRSLYVYAPNDTGSGIFAVTDDGDGNLTGDIDASGTNTIDYDTGVVTVTFSAAPANDGDVTAQYYPYVQGRPDTVLFFSNNFRLRPIPDKPYPFQIQVWKRPTALVADGDSPEITEWWQLLAVGAAKKILEDSMQTTLVEALLPQYREQMGLVLSRTAVQQSTERAATIYSLGINQGPGFGWYGGPYGGQ